MWIRIAGGCAAISALIVLSADTQTSSKSSEEIRLIRSLEGEVLYHQYCAVCHGDKGLGNGPMARVLKTPPSDLTRVALRNGRVFPFQRVQQVISGESEVYAHGTREMPVWGPIFSQVAWDQDLGRVRVYNLTKYLEKIQTN